MNDSPQKLSRRMRPLLGTLVEIGVAGGIVPEHEAIEAAFDEIASLERLMSFQDPRSQLSRLNASRGEWIRLSRPTMQALRLARAMTRASRGLFNCTIGGAMVQRGRLPDHGGAATLPVGVAEDVELRGNRARLRRPVRVTLDGIAKGLAVDRALSVLRRGGAHAAWINAGGDVRASGDIALPVRIRGTHQIVQLRDAAVATSGSGVAWSADRPGEIVSGQDLAAARGQWTVVAHTAWRADALTKVAALAPSAQRNAVIRQFGATLAAVA